jgi:hypothetical protein
MPGSHVGIHDVGTDKARSTGHDDFHGVHLTLLLLSISVL